MSTIARDSAIDPTSTRSGFLRFGPRRVVSALWLFLMLNYLYCDVFGSLDPENLRAVINGDTNGNLELTPGALLAASVLMTIPMASVLVSRIGSFRLARWSSMVAGVVLALVQIATLFVGTLTMYYAYFSAIEIATTATIVVIAWRWRTEG